MRPSQQGGIFASSHARRDIGTTRPSRRHKLELPKAHLSEREGPSNQPTMEIIRMCLEGINHVLIRHETTSGSAGHRLQRRDVPPSRTESSQPNDQQESTPADVSATTLTQRSAPRPLSSGSSHSNLNVPRGTSPGPPAPPSPQQGGINPSSHGHSLTLGPRALTELC